MSAMSPQQVQQQVLTQHIQQQLQHHHTQQQQLQKQLQHVQIHYNPPPPPQPLQNPQFQNQQPNQIQNSQSSPQLMPGLSNIAMQQILSSSSSEQSSRESLTASIAALYPTAVDQMQNSPSHLQNKNAVAFFPTSPNDGQNFTCRLPLVPEDSALSSIYSNSHADNNANVQGVYTNLRAGQLMPPSMGGASGGSPLGLGVAIPGTITRAASERLPRQNTLAQVDRMSFSRHTTK